MLSNNPSPADHEPIRRTIRVVNPRGLHPRIIDLFTRTAKRFAAAVTIWHGEMRGNGKDVWDLIALLVLPDSEVVLEVDGSDAADAVGPLADILAAPGGEDYSSDDQLGDGI
jgi:phosphotransferase system HPr (HPr) family protein